MEGSDTSTPEHKPAGVDDQPEQKVVARAEESPRKREPNPFSNPDLIEKIGHAGGTSRKHRRTKRGEDDDHYTKLQ